MIAALFVEKDGVYYGNPDIDPYDAERDARRYRGPYPIIAHPPCQRWGRFWHGSTRKPHQFSLGDDGGCFHSAINNLIRWGGVLEHPMDSKAWEYYGLKKPPRSGGWVDAGMGLSTCCVFQGHYGHVAGKGTWLLTSKVHEVDLPELIWGKCEQRLHPRLLEKHGYEYARRAE